MSNEASWHFGGGWPKGQWRAALLSVGTSPTDYPAEDRLAFQGQSLSGDADMSSYVDVQDRPGNATSEMPGEGGGSHGMTTPQQQVEAEVTVRANFSMGHILMDNGHQSSLINCLENQCLHEN